MAMTEYEKVLHEAIDSHGLHAHKARKKGHAKDLAMYEAREHFAMGMLIQRQIRTAPTEMTGNA